MTPEDPYGWIGDLKPGDAVFVRSAGRRRDPAAGRVSRTTATLVLVTIGQGQRSVRFRRETGRELGVSYGSVLVRVVEKSIAEFQRVEALTRITTAKIDLGRLDSSQLSPEEVQALDTMLAPVWAWTRAARKRIEEAGK